MNTTHPEYNLTEQATILLRDVRTKDNYQVSASTARYRVFLALQDLGLVKLSQREIRNHQVYYLVEPA